MSNAKVFCIRLEEIMKNIELLYGTNKSIFFPTNYIRRSTMWWLMYVCICWVYLWWQWQCSKLQLHLRVSPNQSSILHSSSSYNIQDNYKLLGRFTYTQNIVILQPISKIKWMKIINAKNKSFSRATGRLYSSS